MWERGGADTAKLLSARREGRMGLKQINTEEKDMKLQVGVQNRPQGGEWGGGGWV